MSCLCTDAIAVRARSAGAAPDNTAQLCAIESILHSVFAAEPSGVPSSKYPRRYQSPSQLVASTRSPRTVASLVHCTAKAASPRLRASGAKRCSTAIRKNASQTLSPLPPAPTRFMPSFQSPAPISGRPCAP